MKTSNILFICLLGLITILLTAGAIRLKSSKESKSENKYKIFYHHIPSAKILYLENCRDITFHQSDSSYAMSVDSEPVNLKYVLRGDTLFFSGLQKPRFTIYLSRTQNDFYLRNSAIQLSDFSGMLSLYADQSTVSFNENKKEIFLNSVHAAGKNNSTFNLSNFKVGLLNLTLQNSTANLTLNIEKIDGKISNESKLVFSPYGSLREISVKKDESSTILFLKNQ